MGVVVGVSWRWHQVWGWTSTVPSSLCHHHPCSIPAPFIPAPFIPAPFIPAPPLPFRPGPIRQDDPPIIHPLNTSTAVYILDHGI